MLKNTQQLDEATTVYKKLPIKRAHPRTPTLVHVKQQQLFIQYKYFFSLKGNISMLITTGSNNILQAHYKINYTHIYECV